MWQNGNIREVSVSELTAEQLRLRAEYLEMWTRCCSHEASLSEEGEGRFLFDAAEIVLELAALLGFAVADTKCAPPSV